MPDRVHELIATQAAIEKLGARAVSVVEAGQLPRNGHLIVGNPNDPSQSGQRRLLIGRTDGGRAITLVIEQTIDPETWLIVTGWSSTPSERNLLFA